jgi:hypothetical protein
VRDLPEEVGARDGVMGAGGPTLELPDFMVECTFTDTESTCGSADEVDGFLDVDRTVERTLQEADHHAIGLHVLEADEHPEVPPRNAGSLPWE